MQLAQVQKSYKSQVPQLQGTGYSSSFAYGYKDYDLVQKHVSSNDAKSTLKNSQVTFSKMSQVYSKSRNMIGKSGIGVQI